MISFEIFYAQQDKTVGDAIHQICSILAKKSDIAASITFDAPTQSVLHELENLTRQEQAYLIWIQKQPPSSSSIAGTTGGYDQYEYSDSEMEEDDINLFETTRAPATPPQARPPHRSPPSPAREEEKAGYYGPANPARAPPPVPPTGINHHGFFNHNESRFGAENNRAQKPASPIPHEQVFNAEEEEKASICRYVSPRASPPCAPPVQIPPPRAPSMVGNHSGYTNGNHPRFGEKENQSVEMPAPRQSPTSSTYRNGRKKSRSWDNPGPCTPEASEDDDDDDDDEEAEEKDCEMDEQTVYHGPGNPYPSAYHDGNYGDADQDEKASTVMTETEPGAPRKFRPALLMIARLLMQQFPLPVGEDLIEMRLKDEFDAMANHYELYQKLQKYSWCTYDNGYYSVKPTVLEQELHPAERERMIRNKVAMLMNTLHKDGLEWRKANLLKIFECWIGWQMTAQDERLMHELLHEETPRYPHGFRCLRRVLSYKEMLVCALDLVDYAGVSREELADIIQYKYRIELDLQNPYIVKILDEIVDRGCMRIRNCYKLRYGVRQQHEFEELLKWWNQNYESKMKQQYGSQYRYAYGDHSNGGGGGGGYGGGGGAYGASGGSGGGGSGGNINNAEHGGGGYAQWHQSVKYYPSKTTVL
eukprot:CAMPEP_0197034788 /NCGR_PEP_ID=MMETSP1384-20130603/12765_1 /TAXON_ID=29189 /ORGANISM="Ammonia sp." /LENGTH=644 /DNA_ID=CAMNT_0042464745 /DNA_START=92 /DNA_END=2026 /DNA_ORIENTATION=+